MLHRIAFGIVLAAVSVPAGAHELTSNVQPPAFELPNCLEGDKFVCDYVLFGGNANGTLPLAQVDQKLPAISSVELRHLPPSGPTGSRLYLLVFNYATPQALPTGDLPQ